MKIAHKYCNGLDIHPSQHQPHITPIEVPLQVVTVVSNPIRFASRYNLYQAFEKQVADAGAVLTTIEVAFGDRPFEITQKHNPRHIQLRSFFELWHKENALNVAIEYLSQETPDWNKVAWIDADVHFMRPDWVQETIQQLEHYMFVQMFSHAIDLGPTFEPLQIHKGFVFSHHNNLETGLDYEKWHPGYAWAARREALDYVGGLIDHAILGSADRHMAAALIGKVEMSYNADLHYNYIRPLQIWQDRAERYIMRDIGYVPGTIAHYWHGKKRDRGYSSRWNILIDEQFDPTLDLKKDVQALWQLTDRNISLRDKIRAYFRSRNEDSIDL